MISHDFLHIKAMYLPAFPGYTFKNGEKATDSAEDAHTVNLGTLIL